MDRGALRSSLLLLVVGLLLVSGNLQVAQAGQYSVRVQHVSAEGNQCLDLDDGTGEEYGFIFEVAGGVRKCFYYETTDDNNLQKDINWDFDVSTTKDKLNFYIEAFEKDSSYDTCQWMGDDDEGQRVQETLVLDLSNMADNDVRSWSFSQKVPEDNDCTFKAYGTYTKEPENTQPGSPRITSTSLQIQNNELKLTIDGKQLDPDPQEKPVVQIFGVDTGCKTGTITTSGTRIECTLTRPESDKVISLDMQVQVQTTYGVSRQATVTFPRCSPGCQNNGSCWWSKDVGALECVCTDYLYYGAQCQNRYPDGEPILQAVSPIGGDYTKEIVIAVSGRAFPDSDGSITDVVCEVSWKGTNQRIAPSGDKVETVRDVVWSGTLQPYDGRTIAQADSLQLKGLCIIPAGTFPQPTTDKREAMVTLIWKRAATGQSIESRDSRQFLLYGPFAPASSIVQVVTNPVDGEMRVFRDQTIRVTIADATGNNRVGGEDSDLFSVNWHAGPSSDPRFGIKGGVTKAFKYSACRTNPANPSCAYYEITVSFDFAGIFKAHVRTTDPDTLNLVNINKGELIFDVKGLGSATLPVPDNEASSIAWADSLKDRTAMPLFDKGLAQLISPNTGARDKSNVLGPLFQRWKGGWFTQRQTVSLAFETALSQATFGSVHVVRGQGVAEPFFCDDHTDELEGGSLSKTLVPWQSSDNVPGRFPLIGLGFSDGDCLTSLKITIELVHRNPDSVGLTLARTGLSSTSPRAKNSTSVVTLKTSTSSTAPTGGAIPAPVVLEYTMQNVPGLSAFKGLPALADWVLTATAPVERGHIKSWYIDAGSEYCLKSQTVDNSICGVGGGQYYARAANVDDLLRLECPQGGVISRIEWARFGKLDGSCDQDNVKVYDGCEANTTIVRQRVESVCVGHTSCELQALDTQFAEEIGEPFLCPGELPPCPDDASLVDAEDVSSTQSKRSGSSKKRDFHSTERRLPWSYPGTEDHYYKSTHVRHAVEPLYRPRRSASERATCTYSAVRPRKALMVKAVCEDSNAAFVARDSPPIEAKMLMASVSADFDNDWKDETVVLYGYEQGPLHAAFTYIEDSKPKTQVYRNLAIGGSEVILGAAGPLVMQTGDFDSDGYPELVFGFVDGTTNKLRLFMWDLDIDNPETWNALAKSSRTNLQPCGCFDKSAIIRSRFDGVDELVVPGEPSFPVMSNDGSTRADSKGFSFSLTAGDIGMFGLDYLAAAWIEDSSTIAWMIYQRNDSGVSPVTSQPMRLRSLKQPRAVAINLANYDGSGACELALGVIDDTNVQVYLYTIDESEEGFPMTQTKVILVNPSSTVTNDELWGTDKSFSQRINLQMVSGDLDDDGDAEVVVAYTTNGIAHITRIDAPGTGTKCRRLDCMEMFGKFTFHLPLGAGADGAPSRSPEIKLAIGNIDDSYANELIVATEYSSTTDSTVNKVMLLSLTAQPNVDDPFSVNGRHCYAGPYYQQNENQGTTTVNNMALTVGNLFGLGFRVGEPITIRYEGVPELVAVINAPPTHYDILGDGDQEIIVNPGTFHGAGSFSQLSNIEGVVSSFEVTHETASARTSSNGFQLNAKIAVVFGNVDLAWQNFKASSENTGKAHIEQIAVARDVVASGDDSVLYLSTDKDVWKYPIVDQNGNQVGSLDIILSSSCGERCVQKADGRDLWWFTPDHEPFNLLTYSSRAPADFAPQNRIMVGEKVAMGPNAHEQWVDQQSGKSQNKVKVGHTADRTGKGGTAGVSVGVDYIFSGAFFGVGPQIKLPIGISVDAGYAGRTEESTETMDASSQSASINRDASVHCYLEAISPTYAYKVQPYVYMARTGSGKEYLKVDYSAEPGYYPGVSSWWQRVYNKPDPSFNLPWWWTTFKKDRTMLTKEIVSTPSFPKLGEVVQVTVTVRNKALVQASDVPITLWRGNPENCLDITCLFAGRTLIGATRVNIIPAQGQRDVSFLVKYDGTNDLHVTIDDRNEIDEIHEDNNHGYNLLFHNLREDGYTLQSVQLDRRLVLKPVKGGPGKKYTQGYDVAMTILGDTFTRQNVLVQLWHGDVGGSGRLISTINVPRVRGSVMSTTRYTLSMYWDTRNTALYGEQELHAVILHSGFDTSPDNIISMVTQTVNVDCYGEVDLCGICGGDNTACAGCDGVPLSEKTVDMCGKCGGDGSTCCVRKPSQASVKYIKLISDNSDTRMQRVKVGDMVVWENLLDWNVKISGGVYDYKGAPAYDLVTLKNKLYPIQKSVPPMTLDEETVNAYVQQYMSMTVLKDHLEPERIQPTVPTPIPDSLSKYLRSSSSTTATTRRNFVASSSSSSLDHSAHEEDHLGLSRFPGFRVETPNRQIAESRLRGVREGRAANRRTERFGFDDTYYMDSGYAGGEDFDNDEEEEFFMDGICCAAPSMDEEVEEDGHSYRRLRHDSKSSGGLPEDYDHDLYQHQLVRKAYAKARVHTAGTTQGSSRVTQAKPFFSLRSLALSILQHQKHEADRISSINSTAITNPEVEQTLEQKRRKTHRSFYDARSHELETSSSSSSMQSNSIPDSDDDDRTLFRRLRCLCPINPSSTTSRLASREAPPPAKPASSESSNDAGKTNDKPAEGGAKDGEPAKPAAAGEPPKPEDNGEASFGGGSLGGAEVGTAAELQGTTSYGVATFSGFGPARGWALYDFADLTKTSVGDPSVLAPGSASAPHRFFSPGIYVWHDSNNPAIHGVIIVDPSDLVKDICGVCGGDGTSCLDCKGTPFGNARRDVCGVCYDPFVDSYDPLKAKDCAGVCNGTAKIDECGYCAGGSTGLMPGFAKDCSGVCNGTTTEYCGVCGASQATHGFLADCAGECFGTRVTNKCGFCVGGDTGLDLSYGMDCTGSCGGNVSRDCRGVCGGTTKIDCTGVCGGDAKINECLQCVGGSTGLDDAQTKTCDGYCALESSQICGASTSTNNTKRVNDDDRDDDNDDGDDYRDDAQISIAGERACSNGQVADKQGTCCNQTLIDCAGLCRGSATVMCGVCVGGSSGVDKGQVMDCKGVCNGTAKYNPCGVCATPEEYYNGTGYYVDCAGVCNGSAYLDDCGACVEGSTGVPPNMDKDCQQVCFGNATTDDCNVCYVPGDGHVPNSDMDCAGVCGGLAVIDDCGSCVLGTTRREFNADKDCAGQCFGQHVITDPACSCPAGQLDQCFVCGGNNTQCAGCDGIPWSGKTRDFCGVCGGNNTACCFLPFAQTTATIKDFEAIILRNVLETGETLAISNLQPGYSYTIIMYRLDIPADVARVKQIQTRWDYATLKPGNTQNIVIAEPGVYQITTVESSSVNFEITVSYNTKALDKCGRCVYAREPLRINATDSEVEMEKKVDEYDQCCSVMPTNQVHGWFERTYYHTKEKPTEVSRVAYTAEYRDAPTTQLIRLIEPHMIWSQTWQTGNNLFVGDMITLENRDSVDHVISFSGPQPMPDILLERGTTITTAPFLKPGQYRIISNKNLINTSFVLDFPFVCTVYAEEPTDDHTLAIILSTVLGGSALILLALVLVIAILAVVVYKCTRKGLNKPTESNIYPL